MSQTVAFRTPGLIDIRAFTTFGVNSKPLTQNPIGYFGTGLKYAVAVLVRSGAGLTVWIGRDRYDFFQRTTKFRDREYQMVRMRRRRWSLLRSTTHDLPFTTELGKNWELWQAYRELESNTRDEGGETFLVSSPVGDSLAQVVHGSELLHPEPDTTLVVVEGDGFAQAHLDRDETFLPGGLAVREEGTRVQVMDRPSRRVYYHALRVSDLDRPTLYTYNFLATLDLTEDRTLKYQHQARAELARHVVTSHNTKLIEDVLTAPEDKWEHGLEFDYQNEPPSDEFRAVVERRRGAVGRSALRYYGGWDTTPLTEEQRTFTRHPRPWRASGSFGYDAKGELVLSGLGERQDQLMTDVVDAVNQAGD